LNTKKISIIAFQELKENELYIVRGGDDTYKGRNVVRFIKDIFTFFYDH